MAIDDKPGAAATGARGVRHLFAVTRDRALPCTYRPRDLVRLVDSDREFRVRMLIVPHLNSLLEGCRERAGAVSVISGYRSYATQRRVFERFVTTELSRGMSLANAETTANRYSARPGYSEHQLGTTVDLSTPALNYDLSSELATTEPGRWLARNAHRFGFVFSYPENREVQTGYVFEPWHMRWIGVQHAQRLHDAGYLDPESDLTVAHYLETLTARRT